MKYLERVILETLRMYSPVPLIARVVNEDVKLGSAGPRSCVGRKYAMLKLKVLLASVLRRFRTISDKDEKDFKLQADIILKREDGFHIRVEERVV
ncbi:hypothetical protein NQ317_016359 [Molorchus minor]|uniref:Cytochrome P450 n=1 Tax=Molorchus minor TaxID=1323400 RepID=A0ABQ9JG93_9CUCU|nr:hypothetical protein NQ317_016359 [Molorchus minor]